MKQLTTLIFNVIEFIVCFQIMVEGISFEHEEML